MHLFTDIWCMIYIHIGFNRRLIMIKSTLERCTYNFLKDNKYIYIAYDYNKVLQISDILIIFYKEIKDMLSVCS